MNFKKGLCYGILIWVLMFVIVSIFIAFNLYGLTLINVIIAVIAGLIALMFAGKLKSDSAGTAFGYALTWLIVMLILDYFVTKKFNPDIFVSWSLWLGYILVFLAPFLKIKKG